MGLVDYDIAIPEADAAKATEALVADIETLSLTVHATNGHFVHQLYSKSM